MKASFLSILNMVDNVITPRFMTAAGRILTGSHTKSNLSQMILHQINKFQLPARFTTKFVVITASIGIICGLGTMINSAFFEILGGFTILIAGIGHVVLGVIHLARLCFIHDLFKEHLFSLYLLSLNIAHAIAWLTII